MRALTNISMSESTPKNTYLYTSLPNIPRSAAITPISVSNSFSNPGILHSLHILPAMSIIIKMKYNESLFLKVSKQELPTDGVQ